MLFTLFPAARGFCLPNEVGLQLRYLATMKVIRGAIKCKRRRPELFALMVMPKTLIEDVALSDIDLRDRLGWMRQLSTSGGPTRMYTLGRSNSAVFCPASKCFRVMTKLHQTSHPL